MSATIEDSGNGEKKQCGSDSDHPGFAVVGGEKSESRLADEPGFGKRRTRKRAAAPAALPFPGDNSAPAKPDQRAAVRGFGKKRQREMLALLMQGASPQVACRKLKLAMASFWHTLEHDAEFAAQLQEVWDALSFNVVAALYQAAIKGNSTAQQFWLKHRPPPRWSLLPGGTILGDDLETLENEELFERARQEAPDFAAEIAARAAKARSRLAPKTLPGNDLRRGESSRPV